jgi:hypothetical protein
MQTVAVHSYAAVLSADICRALSVPLLPRLCVCKSAKDCQARRRHLSELSADHSVACGASSDPAASAVPLHTAASYRNREMLQWGRNRASPKLRQDRGILLQTARNHGRSVGRLAGFFVGQVNSLGESISIETSVRNKGWCTG